MERTGEVKGHYMNVTAATPWRTCTSGPSSPRRSVRSNRPKTEPGFRLDRTETNDRHIHYTLHSYAAETPHGTRYQGKNGSGPEPD